MELYDIINAVNGILDKPNEILVLHRSMKANKVVKVYKKFSYKLFLVKDKDNKELVLSYENEVNCPLDKIDKIWKSEDSKFLEVLIDWISKDFNNIRYGI